MCFIVFTFCFAYDVMLMFFSLFSIWCQKMYIASCYNIYSDIPYLFRLCIYSCLMLCICKLPIYIEIIHLANFFKEIFSFTYKLVTYNMYNVDKYNVNIHIYIIIMYYILYIQILCIFYINLFLLSQTFLFQQLISMDYRS